VDLLKKKLDKQLIGHRQYYARISLENDIDRSELIEILSEKEYEFTMSTRTYLNCNSKLKGGGNLYSCNECGICWEVSFKCEVCMGTPAQMSSCGLFEPLSLKF
jgi:hypothetical protein